MAKSAADTLVKLLRSAVYESADNSNGMFPVEDFTIQKALKQLHDEVIRGLPEKKYSVQFGYQGMLMGIKGAESDADKPYNQCLDDVTKFLDTYFKGEQE